VRVHVGAWVRYELGSYERDRLRPEGTTAKLESRWGPPAKVVGRVMDLQVRVQVFREDQPSAIPREVPISRVRVILSSVPKTLVPLMLQEIQRELPCYSKYMSSSVSGTTPLDELCLSKPK
jgi:hypothetical protein